MKTSTTTINWLHTSTIDWSLKESVRRMMRSKVRRLFAKYDYPPGHEKKVVELVLQQAELFGDHECGGRR
jgi:type I restriction enzyme R subunit